METKTHYSMMMKLHDLKFLLLLSTEPRCQGRITIQS